MKAVDAMTTDIINAVMNINWNHAWDAKALNKKILYLRLGTVDEKLEKERSNMTTEDFDIYCGSFDRAWKTYIKAGGTCKMMLQYIIETIKADPSKFKINYRNFNFLKDSPYFGDIWMDFDSNFRGDIVKIHEIYSGKYVIIEVLKGDKSNFYSIHNMTYVFDNFEHCMISAMFKKHFQDAVTQLYDHQD